VRAFGLEHFGKIFGMLFLAICVGTGTGPVIVAFVARQWGYSSALLLASGASFVAALLVLGLRSSLQTSADRLPTSPAMELAT
jgi:hypothetical protein